MIQRVQSIYIILSILVVFISSLFPFGTYEIEGQIVSFGAFGWNSENNLFISSNPEFFSNYPYFIGYLLTISLSIFTLLKYKNRKSQLSLGKANYFVLLITITYMFLSVKNDIVSEDPTYGIGLYLLVSAIPFVFLANRGIKNDEKLIKSLDRLR